MSQDKVNECVNPNVPEYFNDSIQELLASMEQLGARLKEVAKRTNRIVGRRSVPGKGKPVYVTVMQPNPENIQYDFIHTSNGVSYMTSIDEDYAQCGWPVVLKVKPGTKKEFVVKALREQARNIEGYEMDIFEPVDVNFESTSDDKGVPRDEDIIPF